MDDRFFGVLFGNQPTFGTAEVLLQRLEPPFAYIRATERGGGDIVKQGEDVNQQKVWTEWHPFRENTAIGRNKFVSRRSRS